MDTCPHKTYSITLTAHQTHTHMTKSIQTIDVTSAMCVGVNQAVVGHPLDTVKVLMQTRHTVPTAVLPPVTISPNIPPSTNPSPIQWHKLPWRHYYRGVVFPLITGVGFNGTVFPVYEAVRREYDSPVLAGFVSGVMVTPIVAVSEGAKIIRQTSTTRKLTTEVVRRGMLATFLRETISMSTYFGTYAYLREKWDIHPFWAGGLCGLAGWTVSYPVDVIRSRQVVSETRLGFREAMVMGRLWVGFPACAVRAIIVNSTNFAVYEGVREWMGGDAE